MTYAMRLPMFAVVLAVWGCLPSLEDECAADDDCPTARICAGGVCSPLAADAASDVAPDALPPDVGPDAAVDAMPDAAPAVDIGPMVDEGPLPDAGCLPQPGACNQLDDDCDGRIDEQSEAVEGCEAVPGSLAACDIAGCAYACEPGAVPVSEVPADGCRVARGCVLEGEWTRVAEGFEKAADDAQQVVLTGREGERFVAAYDLLANGMDPVVRSFVFVEGQPAEAVSLRLGARASDVRDPPQGLNAATVGDRYVVSAWLPDGDANDRVQLMIRSPDASAIRDVLVDWPQPPALAVVDGADPTLVTVIESHIDRGDPPRGLLVVDAWQQQDGRDEVFPAALPVPERAVGPQQNAAFAIGDRVAMVGDVVDVDDMGEPRYALRFDRFTPLRNLGDSDEVPLPGPIASRLSVARGAAGLVIFAAIAEAETLQWWTARADGGGFEGEVVSMPWRDVPAAPQALSLPGGPGVLYRDAERIRLALPDPGFEDFAFEGHLPDAGDKVRALAAWQPAPDREPGVVEVAALREAGGQGVLVFGRYVCH